MVCRLWQCQRPVVHQDYIHLAVDNDRRIVGKRIDIGDHIPTARKRHRRRRAVAMNRRIVCGHARLDDRAGLSLLAVGSIERHLDVAGCRRVPLGIQHYWARRGRRN